jgi:hypothetical protein
MKILLLWDYYDRYLRYFYAQNPDTAGLSYRQQQQQLLADYFNWYTYLIPYFREMGHDVEMLVGNARQLQVAWARENDLGSETYDRSDVIVAEQIRRFQPDMLWVAGADHYLGAYLRNIRSSCGSVVAWRAVDWSPNTDWTNVDCIFSSYANLVERFRRMGKRSELVLPCFEENILHRLPCRDRDIDLSFIGSMNVVQFARRLEMLKYLRQQVPLQIYAERPSWRRRPLPLRPFLSQMRFFTFFLRAQRKPAVYGLDMFNIMQRSRITLNVHERSSANLAGNIRMFEATGSGTLLLTEAAPNLSQLFEPDKEVVTYRSAEEAVSKVRYYLQNLSECEAIARAGQQRTLRCHSARVRANEILQIFGDLLGSA